MSKMLKMRFLNNVDKENKEYVTIFLYGPKYGCFHRESKDNFLDGANTTISPNKGMLYEVRFLGCDWQPVNKTEFMVRLASINGWRKKQNMPTILLPGQKAHDDPPRCEINNDD